VGRCPALESGGTVVNATNAEVASGSLITCALNLQGVPASAYDVVVRNPDGSEGRLAGGFSVTAAVPPIACGQGAGMTLLVVGLMVGLLSLAHNGRLARKLR
jgi:hypothetical protein